MNKSEFEKFCHECGAVINIRAEICPRCGVRQPQNAQMMPVPDQGTPWFKQGAPRNKKTAGILALLLGGLGIHRFYLGRPFVGAVYVLFCLTLIPALVAFIEALNFWFMSDAVFERRYSGQAYTW